MAVGDKCRIMIIDDEFIMRQGIRYMLNWEAEGYEVAGEASNGKEALDILEEIQPDIILCDIAMPVMDGLDFIKIVKQKYPEIQILVLSSYDKFDYVRQALVNGAVDYVLKPTLNPEMLLNIVSKAAEKIPGVRLKKKDHSPLDLQLERYFTGYDEKLNPAEFQKVFQNSCYRLLAVPLRRQGYGGVDFSVILYEKTEDMLREQKYAAYVKFILKQEILCVILNYGIKDEQRLLCYLQQLMEQLGVLQEWAFGVLGPRRMKLELLKKDFESSGFLEEEIFYNKGSHLCCWEEKEEERVCEKFDFRKFAGCLSSHQYENALHIFRTYIAQAISFHMPEFKLKNQTKNLLYNIVSSTDEYAEELENLRKEMFLKIENADYCEDFEQVLEELDEKLRDILFRGEGQDIYLQKIQEYIQKHYREEIDLQSLADAFSFNYSYLSAYFNAHMGEGFSEYLNRVRIEKACEYLENKEDSIAQISTMVGYSDHSYFCRVFKRITGKTPSVYRRERRQEV